MSRFLILCALVSVVGCNDAPCGVADYELGKCPPPPPADAAANARVVGDPPASMCDLSDDGTGHARTQQLRGCWEADGLRCAVCNYTCTLPGVVCVSSCEECPSIPAPGGAPALR